MAYKMVSMIGLVPLKSPKNGSAYDVIRTLTATPNEEETGMIKQSRELIRLRLFGRYGDYMTRTQVEQVAPGIDVIEALSNYWTPMQNRVAEERLPQEEANRHFLFRPPLSKQSGSLLKSSDSTRMSFSRLSESAERSWIPFRA